MNCRCENKPLTFSDALVFDAATRTVISARDGFQEYYGQELGIEPFDKMFKVYRSAATLKAVAPLLVDLPVTDDHVPMDEAATRVISKITTSKIIDAQYQNDATVCLKNTVDNTDKLEKLLQSNVNELSLAYSAKIRQHDKYDLEQYDLEPHHLAVVEKGRCGDLCRFVDKKGKPMDVKTFLTDAEGAINIERVSEILKELPDMMTKMPVDKLPAVAQALEAILASIKGEAEDEDMEGEKVEDDDMEEAKDMKGEKDKDAKDGESYEDSAKFKDALQKAVEKAVKIAVKDCANELTAVVERARDVLPAEYSFKGKDAKTIMRDALATQHTENFADHELSVAFKMLRKQADYSKFGDTQSGGFLSLASKKLGE